MVDTLDLKSNGRKAMSVRPRPSAQVTNRNGGMEDTVDSKSTGASRAGSSPAFGTDLECWLKGSHHIMSELIAPATDANTTKGK